MASEKPTTSGKPSRIAAAIRGGQDAREDLRTGQSRINRSSETQAAVDEFFGQEGEK